MAHLWLTALLFGSAPVCAEVSGLAPLFQAGTVLLVGEIHGTVESPQFVRDAACLARQASLPVTLALEIPEGEAARIAAFLASAGSAKDRDALVESPFWKDTYQDGRRSQAMLALLEWARGRGDRGLTVVPIDVGLGGGAQQRDAGMAAKIAGLSAQSPAGLIVAFTGNYHTRTVPSASLETMGAVLKRLHPEMRLIALDVQHTGGTAWTCTSAEASSCGERPIPARPNDLEPRVVLFEKPNINGFHGGYRVGQLTASPPAVK